MITNLQSQFQSRRLRRFLRFGVVFVLSGVVLVLLLLGRTDDVLADGEAPLCLTTVNDAACLTLTAPPFTGTIDVSTVDGVEWSGAPSKDLIHINSDGTTTVSGTVKFLTNDDKLYLFITSDTNVEYVDLHFDPQHQHDIADVVSFRIRLDGTVDRTTYDSFGNPSSDPIPAPSVGVSATSLPYLIEIEIDTDASGLAMTDLPPILGFAIESLNGGFERIASWPPLSSSTIFKETVDTWPNLKTRYPIEYMIVLDQSGSMLGHEKWNDAKKAANLLADTLAALAEPTSTYFDDQLGIVTFAWNCSETDGNLTETALALTPIPTPFPDDYTSSLIDPAANNCTPIGEGLRLGFTEVGTGIEETERFLLLLSDGLHNRPDDSLQHTAADLGYDPCPMSDPGDWSCSDSVVTVHSVAFGPPGSGIVDEGLLQNIVYGFSNDLLVPNFTVAWPSAALDEIFITSLDRLYPVNEIQAVYAPSSSSELSFDPGDDNYELIVILSWSDAADASDFTLNVDGSLAPCDSYKPVMTSGYAICVVDDPPGGSYDVSVSDSTLPDSQFVLADLSLRARFGIDRKIHGTGKAMTLTADLNEKGTPMTSEAGYTVVATVDLVRPDEGLGQFLSTHTPDDCEQLDGPVLPEPGPDSEGWCPLTFGSGLPTTVSLGNDPSPPLFILAGQMLEVCGKEEGLERVNEPDLILVDDGTNGDAVAGDGIYSGRIVPEHEGSYVFRFNVAGTTPTGEKFTRTKLMAQYVRLEVDLDHSEMGSRVWWQGENSVIEEFYIIPRDAYGRHLGPGHADQVHFAASGGEWVSPVHDYGNGIYARLLKYNKDDDHQVEYIVQNESAIPPDNGIDWRVILLLLVAILLMLITLIGTLADKWASRLFNNPSETPDEREGNQL